MCFVWKSGSWKHLFDGNRKTISWRRKPGKHLQLLQIPLAKPVFHDHHETWAHMDHAAGLPHKSASNILRPVASLEQIHQSIKTPNNHRHLSLRTAKNLSLNLKAHQLVQSCGPSILSTPVWVLQNKYDKYAIQLSVAALNQGFFGVPLFSN